MYPPTQMGASSVMGLGLRCATKQHNRGGAAGGTRQNAPALVNETLGSKAQPSSYERARRRGRQAPATEVARDGALAPLTSDVDPSLNMDAREGDVLGAGGVSRRDVNTAAV